MSSSPTPNAVLAFNSAPFDAAIVDLDGTMIDTLGDFVVALNLMLADLALPPVDRAKVARLVGKGSEHLIKSLLVLVSIEEFAIKNEAFDLTRVPDPLFERAWESYQRHYLAINGQHAQVFPGVMAGLQQLQTLGIRLACLTNKPVAFARPLLASKGLDGFFDVVFGGDSFARKKPDPLPLLETCKALGTLPAQTLMIGDSRNDAQAGHAAGCPVVLVRYGYNHGEPIEQVPALVHVDRLDALVL